LKKKQQKNLSFDGDEGKKWVFAEYDFKQYPGVKRYENGDEGPPRAVRRSG